VDKGVWTGYVAGLAGLAGLAVCLAWLAGWLDIGKVQTCKETVCREIDHFSFSAQNFGDQGERNLKIVSEYNVSEHFQTVCTQTE
jgi:hypothetical protein